VIREREETADDATKERDEKFLRVYQALYESK